MSIVVINRNFPSLEAAAAALATVTTHLLTNRKGHPADIFGQPVAGGVNCKLAFSIRKFNNGWEGVTEGSLLFNFADQAQMLAAQSAIEAQIFELLPQADIQPGYVLRLGFVA
ncbi:MAG: hypothetical protein JNN26_21830 [Candidatus Obscuribacter sp.]|nr:hypothetical protein [Candidatus Obscuribacter sp.]HND07869.1 hypothetical protein [Candidatus Obscuribacter sp.]